MVWYTTGSINLTNGSTNVTGVGTDFVSNVLAGQALVSSDGKPYEIQQVVSATVLLLRTPYLGGNVSGAGYSIMPTQSIVKDLADQAAALIASFANVRDGIGAGLIADGSPAAPGLRFSADQDTGFRRYSANGLSLVTSGVDRLIVNTYGAAIGIGAPDAKAAFLVQGADQQVSAITDAGGHGASAFLRASGAAAGDGGALLFGTAASNQTPYAAIKGLLTDGTTNTKGDLAISLRGLPGDVALTERFRVTAAGSLSLGAGAAPMAQMHVKGIGQSTNDVADSGPQGSSLFLQDTSGVAGSGGALLLGTSNGDATPFAYVKGALTNGSNRTTGDLVFGTRTSISTLAITGRFKITNGGHFMPVTDNINDVGGSGNRVRTIYAATGTINTSDQRLKQQVDLVPDEWLDAWGEVRHVRFKFNDSVEEKGDAARWHLGFIAQEIKAAFDAKGVDATMIGLLCYDRWDEETEEETEAVTRIEQRPRFTPSASLVDATGKPLGTWSYDEVPITETVPTGRTKVTREAGDRWSLRYDECQAIDSAWQRREMNWQRDAMSALRAQIVVLQAAGD